MSKPAKSRLGRGLSSLIRSDLIDPQPNISPPTSLIAAVPASDRRVLVAPDVQSNRPLVAEVPLDQIRTNPSQPRRSFDATRLNALAESLKHRGALQPIVVRPIAGGYELVAGERRLRASKIAGLAAIPVIIRPIDDNETLEVALVENVQREDLNPVEKARAYQMLTQKYGLTHDEIATRMGEDRASVSNTIRLLGLTEECLELLSAGAISVGHAKAILSVSKPAEQLNLAKKIVREGWSVRRAEKEAAALTTVGKPPAESKTPDVRPAVREMQEQLAAAIGTKVRIREGRRRHSGRIVIEYYNLDDFERICRAIGVAPADGDI